jgi:hypothetical protein
MREITKAPSEKIKISKQRKREKLIAKFRESEFYPYVIGLINEEINEACDVRNLPADIGNKEETAELLILNQKFVNMLELLRDKM